MKEDIFLLEKETEIHPAALIMPPMSDVEFKEFKEDISGNGLLEPVVIFQDKVLDGRNRYFACKELGIDIYAIEWEGGMDPVEYVVSKNIHRRHLTASQKGMAAAKALDFYSQEAKARKESTIPEKGQKGFQSNVSATLHEHNDNGKAAEKAGKVFDVSPRTVHAAKIVLEHGTEEEKKAVETGKASVSATEKQIKEREKAKPRPAEKQTFNRTNDNIKWSLWTWNPVTGCKYDCIYCYAKDIAMRFNGHFEPEFHPNRLDAPKNTRPKNGEPSNVFVCSMADLFGEWIRDEWIRAIIKSTSESPEWNYLFLTKNPSRYLDFEFPENCILGATTDTQKRFDKANTVFRDIQNNIRFMSFEPLHEHINTGTVINSDWVIIGGRSKNSNLPAFQPQWGWVEHIQLSAIKNNIPYFFKPNLTVKPEGMPLKISELYIDKD
jgi:protein gp37/ParB-like chromosome segregation protein Spo0J